MSDNQLPPNAMFMTASQKPIIISSTSIQRAEQIMTQAATKEISDQFDDDIDDDELCRACHECDELYNASQISQSQQQQKLNQFEETDNLTQNSLKRKRLGISTTPNERRAIIKRH
ncbi:unnamed protein product [Adineta steineri]|uniref:Uncharacterized protein n=1 Tax=Adineta steineri TaxID=433720 RepID=A0A818K0X6_9BILA|nr:unnamed protein product [Adineta steineri]CAF3549610.1 unnamed protein product [Adineta steineri]